MLSGMEENWEQFFYRYLASRLGRTQRLISWDFSIDENESPVLIEANLTYGQFDFHQMCNWPLFNDKIVDVLSMVEKSNGIK